MQEVGASDRGAPEKRRVGQPARCRASVGLLSVTASALLFGVVASMVKLASMQPLLMLQCRSAVQWLISLLSVAWFGEAAARRGERAAPRWLALLFGPRPILHWLLLRALLYWAFMALWWSALVGLPVGDATAIVYCGPMFTSVGAMLFLGERAPRHFAPCLLLDLLGVALITQPGFLLAPAGARRPSPDDQYFRGVAFALASCFVSGQLPVLARLSRQCHWSTVEHATSSLSAFVFTPAALAAAWWVQLGRGSSPDDDAAPCSLSDLALVCSASVVEFVGLGLQTFGYQREEAMKASLMVYVEIPFSYVLQLAMFKQPAGAAQLLGMLAIMASAVAALLLQQRGGG